MIGQRVVVYINDNSPDCKKLLNELNYWQIGYETRNVSKNRRYMEYLQENGIFGTPATIVNDQMILGSQINKIKRELGMMRQQSYGNVSNNW
ncbi:glutaredoxin family protein [Lentibacillus cibarius]|uniref:Glutaredoxin family protein n=1 Tax=Lentibacillus cibarius TaxID=2583219 RepID=A0A5S3QKU3_9BACI|nr:glutaredoxin family protein [Lentibacillus cibarius]TMN22554.1 glutaredoxin family protein [Lentibacillus cibarius]